MPHVVLMSIMSFLRMKEAGKTSVVSQTWYNLWHCLHVLFFKVNPYSKIKDKLLLPEQISGSINLIIFIQLSNWSYSKIFLGAAISDMPKVQDWVLCQIYVVVYLFITYQIVKYVVLKTYVFVIPNCQIEFSEGLSDSRKR